MRKKFLKQLEESGYVYCKLIDGEYFNGYGYAFEHTLRMKNEKLIDIFNYVNDRLEALQTLDSITDFERGAIGGYKNILTKICTMFDIDSITSILRDIQALRDSIRFMNTNSFDGLFEECESILNNVLDYFEYSFYMEGTCEHIRTLMNQYEKNSSTFAMLLTCLLIIIRKRSDKDEQK